MSSLRQFSDQVQHRSKLFSLVVQACRKLLIAKPNAQFYVNSRLSSPAQDLFEVGYFPNNQELPELYKLVDRELLLELGLVYQKKIYQPDQVDLPLLEDCGLLAEHNIILPYRDVYGNILSLCGRSLLDEDQRKSRKLQKYKYTPFLKMLQLFGLWNAKEEIERLNSVYICEGQIDTISCIDAGIKNVVGLGGSSLTKYQFNLLRRYTDRMVLMLDMDLEGIKASKRIMKKFAGKGVTIKEVEWPEKFKGCKDIDSLLKGGLKTEVIDYLKEMNG